MPRILFRLRPFWVVLQIGIKSQGYREPGSYEKLPSWGLFRVAPRSPEYVPADHVPVYIPEPEHPEDLVPAEDEARPPLLPPFFLSPRIRPLSPRALKVEMRAMRAEIEVLRRERLAYEQEILETEVRRHEWQRQAADDLDVQHIMYNYDNESSDGDNDDDDVEKEEEDGEEEEHLAPVDPFAVPTNDNTTNNQRGTGISQKVNCYECGNQGHYRRDCPERKNPSHKNQIGGTGAHGVVHTLRGEETDQDPNNIKDGIKA
ncbi:putative reverse transcriptase domain-containing protein [Tanacetum coccineum]